MNVEMEGVMVRAFSVVRIEAKRNSFQAKMTLKIAVVASPDAASGSTIRKKAP